MAYLISISISVQRSATSVYRIQSIRSKSIAPFAEFPSVSLFPEHLDDSQGGNWSPHRWYIMEAVRTYSAKTEKKWLKNAGISYMMPYIMVVIGWAFLLGSLFLFVGKLGDHGKLSGFNVIGY